MQEMIMQILQPKVLTTIATSASMFLLLWFILGRGIFRDLFKLIDDNHMVSFVLPVMVTQSQLGFTEKLLLRTLCQELILHTKGWITGLHRE